LLGRWQRQKLAEAVFNSAGREEIKGRRTKPKRVQQARDIVEKPPILVRLLNQLAGISLSSRLLLPG
jgi:hypothetical protein